MLSYTFNAGSGILTTCNPFFARARAESVLKALNKIACVKEAYKVYGVYDVIAKIEADTMDKLGEIVTGRMQRLDKVRSTQLMVVRAPN